MVEEINKVLKEARSQMGKAINHFQSELTKIQAGKASPDLVDGIMVPYYGNPTPIDQVANITVTDMRTLTVKPWEKSMLQEVERAILAANIGITPQNDGESIRLFMPPMTEERRKELVKKCGTEAELAKVVIRGARKDAMDGVKKLKDESLSEDAAKNAEGEIQGITNSFVSKIDDMVTSKEKQIMTV